MAHVAEWKRKEIAELRSILTGHSAVAIVGLDKIPARQLQQIRRGLRGQSELRMSRNRLIKRALEEASEERPGIDALEPYIHGNTAILATDMNPFKLYRTIASMETQAPAKPGDVVPQDIKLKKGPTPFKPGPIVGELQRVGIPAAIDSGKVVIRKDHVLLRAGDTVDAETAAVLARLEIMPMTVGIDTRAVYEDGTVFTADVLDVDIDSVRADIAAAHARAMNLALNAAYPTRATVRLLLAMAHRHALALAIEAGIPTRESLPHILAAAHVRMLALASRAPDALDHDLRSMLSSSSTDHAPRKEEAPPGEDQAVEEEKEEEEVGKDEAAAGLGALFG